MFWSFQSLLLVPFIFFDSNSSPDTSACKKSKPVQVCLRTLFSQEDFINFVDNVNASKLELLPQFSATSALMSRNPEVAMLQRTNHKNAESQTDMHASYDQDTLNQSGKLATC
jgi:hypothetical protein